jgi:hypothetical protein
MRRHGCSIIHALALGFVLFAGRAGAQDVSEISPAGTTVLRTRLNRSEVKTVIRTARVKGIGKEVTVISNLEISVNGQRLAVPTSVFTGLSDPREASLEFDNGDFLLRITDTQTPNSGFVVVYFTKTQVSRKEVYSGFEPSKPAKDTAYAFKALEDR